MKTKIIAMLLVVCMLVLALASCNGSGEQKETNEPQLTPEADPVDKWEGVSFDGETIIVNLSTYQPNAAIKVGATNSIKYIAGPDEYTTDAVQNAVFDRNKNVAEKLGLYVTYQECDQYSNDPENTLVVIENFVLADLEDSPDIVSTMSYGVVRAGVKGDLYNALTDKHENYLDLSSIGWYSDYMYDNTLDNTKVFMLAGDYFIDVLRYSFATLVNLDMYEEVFASEGGTESLFEIIEAGEWTYDEFARCVQMAYVDAGTVGKMDDGDTYGAINDCWWFTRSLLATSGLDVFETTADGKLQYVEDISDLHNFTDAVMKLASTQGFNYEGQDGSNSYDHMTIFVQGKSLFATDSLVLSMEGAMLQNMDEKTGLIPFPKYDKEQSYGALVSDNANVGGILYSSDKFTECSAFLQMSTELSNNGQGSLIYEYYDVTLKYKLSNDPKQVAMLEFIRDGICSPKSMIYDDYNRRQVGMKMVATHIDNAILKGVNTFASDWEAQYSAVQSALEAAILTYGQQQ